MAGNNEAKINGGGRRGRKTWEKGVYKLGRPSQNIWAFKDGCKIGRGDRGMVSAKVESKCITVDW